MQFLEILNLALGLLASILSIVIPIKSLNETKSHCDTHIDIRICHTCKVTQHSEVRKDTTSSNAELFVIFLLILSVALGEKLEMYIIYILLIDIVAGVALQLWILLGCKVYFPSPKMAQYVLFSMTPFILAVVYSLCITEVNSNILQGNALFKGLGSLLPWLFNGLLAMAVCLLILLEISSVLAAYLHGFAAEIFTSFLRFWSLPLYVSAIPALTVLMMKVHFYPVT